MKAYRIKNWNKIFENNESRKLKKLMWIPVPTKWEGLGYTRLMKHKNAISVFAGWNLIIQIGSKCPHRGLLANEDSPLTAEDMKDLTRMPTEVFERTLSVLSDPKEGINWIDEVEISKTVDGWRVIENLPQSPDASGFDGVEEKGMEGNRKEGNGMGEGAPAPANRDHVFPAWETVKASAQNMGLPEWRTKDWFDKMEEVGWVDEKERPIRNWQAGLSRIKGWWEADGRPMERPKKGITHGSTQRFQTGNAHPATTEEQHAKGF